MTQKHHPALAPMCFRKLKEVDPELGRVTGKFWATVWGTERALPPRYKYLIALGMALAAGRDRQATRELIKAYGAGATLDELRETFMLIPWNFGVSYFCSEVSTGTPMRALELIAELEGAGMTREAVVKQLKTRLKSQIGFEGE
ncbi:MAG: hypothetical protein DRI79_02700 [Chloroflexi bacterium]|mgnify:CR=1 FL=1|nr:MAG: hypothetical protein DRI80_05825 [Chloroflexota bacterium]RLC91503.1 MAG: hypothetical protein DRI79_02700 [Chloroflexota bacterium]